MYYTSTPVARQLGSCLILMALSLLIAPSTLAQCGNNRYEDPIFDSERTYSNLQYGNAPALTALCLFEFITTNENLVLDIYEPVGDTAALRPAIVYAHAGAFAFGDKRMPPVTDYCHEMAKRGYVVLSINYRKCFNGLSESSAIRAVYRAVQDMNAAIRYTKELAPVLRIDTNLVFAGGSSAGAFMAMHGAYVDEDERAAFLPETYDFPNLGCLDCTGNNYTHSSKPAGVINLWGAMIDTALLAPSDPPLISFHGLLDIIVFPDYWSPFSWPFFPAVYGSLPLDEQAGNLGIPNELHIFPLEGHEPWLNIFVPGNFDYITNNSARFLYEQFLTPPSLPIAGSETVCAGSTNFYSVPFYPQSSYCWDVTGGTLLSISPDGSTAEILWSSAGSASVSVTETNIYGASGTANTLAINIDGVCCPTPDGLNESFSSSSVTVSWNPVTEATSYVLQGRKSGSPSGITQTITTTSRTVDGLEPSTAYQWRVQTNCATESSDFTPIRTFVTPSGRDAHITDNPASQPAADKLLLFPNPTTGSFQLVLDKPASGNLITIADPLGRTVHSELFPAEQRMHQIELSNSDLSPGIYFVEIEQPDGANIMKRITLIQE